MSDEQDTTNRVRLAEAAFSSSVDVVLDHGAPTERRVKGEVKDGVVHLTLHVPSTEGPLDDGNWFKIEQNGHRTYYGRVTPVDVYGVTMLKIEVPAPGFRPIEIAPSSIFSRTQMTRAEVEQLANRSTRSIGTWEMVALARPQAAALPAANDAQDAEYEDENRSDDGDESILLDPPTTENIQW